MLRKLTRYGVIGSFTVFFTLILVALLRFGAFAMEHSVPISVIIGVLLFGGVFAAIGVVMFFRVRGRVQFTSSKRQEVGDVEYFPGSSQMQSATEEETSTTDDNN